MPQEGIEMHRSRKRTHMVLSVRSPFRESNVKRLVGNAVFNFPYGLNQQVLLPRLRLLTKEEIYDKAIPFHALDSTKQPTEFP